MEKIQNLTVTCVSLQGFLFSSKWWWMGEHAKILRRVNL